MNKTAVFLKGAFEPVILDEPLDATMMNMSAAANANLIFFRGNDVDGRTVVISIPQIQYMRDDNEDD